ncbi:MAG: hypothetical protein V1780_06830, partial [Chloroflexota bacterium]
MAVNAGQAVTANPGATVDLKAVATVNDSSKVTGYQWTQTAGVKATIDNDKSDAIKVTLGTADAYKATLLGGLEVLDRYEVMGINPHALSSAETATFKVTVTTSSGSYSGTVTVTANLPYHTSLGIQDVPVGVPVLLNGKMQNIYSWTVAAPSGSKAAITGATGRNPSFTPDVAGKYTVTENNTKTNIDIYAGTWQGAITGQDKNGEPLAAGCTVCHNDKAAPDMFTAWKASGHAEIFTQNINDPAGHWSLSCAECHGVGYDLAATNGGWDEAMAAEGWKAPPHGEAGLWTEILKDYPKTAKLANIQCENCHGPNSTSLHLDGKINAERVSISADVCGACHGEPARHGRYQQW